MKLQAAIRGNLEKLLEAEIRAGEEAVTAAMREASDGLKGELRGQVTSAGLGGRLAKTWRSQVYPKSGRSLGAAALVYSKAPRIVRAFAEGTTIRARGGGFLAIPTPAAPKRGVGGKRISPSTWPEARFGPLRFVSRGSGRPSLLVAENLRAGTGKRGGFRRASATALRTGRGLATVVMFVLVRQVRLKKRLSVDAAARRWLGRLPNLILKHWRSAGTDGGK